MKNWKKKKLLKQHPLPDKSCSFQTAQINAYIFFGQSINQAQLITFAFNNLATIFI